MAVRIFPGLRLEFPAPTPDISGLRPDISGLSGSGWIYKGRGGLLLPRQFHNPPRAPSRRSSCLVRLHPLSSPRGTPASDLLGFGPDLHPLGVGIDSVHLLSAMDSSNMLYFRI